MLKKLIWPSIVILSALYAGILAWSNSTLAIRPVFMFGFLLLCPGMALIGLFHLEDTLSELVLAVALSLVLSTLLAGLLLVSHLWSPSAELAVLIVISFIGANLQIKNVLTSKPTVKEML